MKDFEKQDIKTNPITAEQLEYLKQMAGSYEILFSKRALLYKEMKLKYEVLDEKDYKRLILEEYTFLKRPVIVYEGQVFIGGEMKTKEEARNQILSKSVN